MPKRILRHESAAARRPGTRSPVAVWSVAVAVIAAVTATGLALSVSSAPASPPAAVHANSSATAVGSPQAHVRLSGGVPVDYRRTQAGAEAAAQNFVIVSGSSAFLTDTSARHAAMATLAAGSSVATMTEVADSEAGAAMATLKGAAQIDASEVIARTGVLSVHTLGFDIHRAMFRLWTVAIQGNDSGDIAPSSTFQSVTVSLVWQANDWKVESSSVANGLVAPTEYQQGTSNSGDFSGFTAEQAQDAFVSGALGAAGYPSPYARSQDGAQEAATSAAMLWGDPRFFANDSWRHQMLAAVAAPSALSTIRADADSTAQQVQQAQGINSEGTTPDGGVLVTGTAVLATRVVAYSDESASFQLWTASIGGIAGADDGERPQVAYLLMTVDLSWSGGTWKVSAVSPGDPLVPSPPDTEASSGQDFSEIGGAADAPTTA